MNFKQDKAFTSWYESRYDAITPDSDQRDIDHCKTSYAAWRAEQEQLKDTIRQYLD